MLSALRPADVRKFFLRVSTQAKQLKDAYEKSQGHIHQQAPPHEVSVPKVMVSNVCCYHICQKATESHHK